MKVIEVRAGKIRHRKSPEGAWTSAIEKLPISEPVRLTRLGVEGDHQADRRYHGGPDKAILAYSLRHYESWRQELGWHDFGPGVLGENFVVEDQDEADVCIGDLYRVGLAVVEVSQPRQPCYKPARLHGFAPLTNLMSQCCRTGWYLRVLEEGEISAPCSIELIGRPNPDWTILRALRLLYHNAEPPAAWADMGALPQLSGAWKQLAAKKATQPARTQVL